LKKVRNLSLLLALVIVLIPMTNAFSAGYNLAGVGAKALSMSGAFRAISDDWSAMYWNPAGLAGQGSSIFLEAKLLYPIATVTPNVGNQIPGYGFYRNGVEMTSVADSHPSGAFAYQHQINEKMTFGISAFAPTAIGIEWNRLTTGLPYGYGNDEWPDIDWASDLKVLEVHPTIGYQVNDKLKVGAGIIINYAMISLQSPTLVPTGAPMPYQNVYALGELEGSGMGYGFNVGAIYDVTEKFHVGASYKSAVTIPLEGQLNQTAYYPNNPALYAATGNPVFLGGTASIEPDVEADFPLPQEFGVGFAYNVTEKLTVAFDFAWTDWSFADEVEMEVDGIGLDGEPSENQILELFYEDIIRYNVGFNYVINDKNEFRMGYYLDPTAIPDETIRPAITDVADKHSISFGYAYKLTDKVLCEAYWEHLFSAERTVEDMDNDGDGAYDNVAGDWKLNVDTFGIQFTYYFE